MLLFGMDFLSDPRPALHAYDGLGLFIAGVGTGYYIIPRVKPHARNAAVALGNILIHAAGQVTGNKMQGNEMGEKVQFATFPTIAKIPDSNSTVTGSNNGSVGKSNGSRKSQQHISFLDKVEGGNEEQDGADQVLGGMEALGQRRGTSEGKSSSQGANAGGNSKG